MAIDARSIQTFIIASSISLTATAVSGQSTPPAGAGGFQKEVPRVLQISDGESMAAHLKFGMTRAAAIDADLKSLIDDMNMFAGEIKVEAMARAVTLLADRLSTMRQQMTAMHQLMMHMTTDRVWDDSDAGRSTAPDEVEPEAMCRETRF